MRNQYKVLAEKYQAINEDVAKTGFDRFAEVYEKINTTVETLDRLHKEYSEEYKLLRAKYYRSGSNSRQFPAEAVKLLEAAFIKKHNLQEYFETILKGINLSRGEKQDTLLNLLRMGIFSFSQIPEGETSDRVHLRKWITAMFINNKYVEWYSDLHYFQ